MNNTNQQLYLIYKNTESFYSYRGLVSLDKEMSQDQFIKSIQKDKYVLLSAVSKSFVIDDNGDVDNSKLKGIQDMIGNFNEKSETEDLNVVHILLVYTGTDCESKRANMMKLINHVRFPCAEILIITPTKISSSVAKGIQALTNQKEHRHHTFRSFTYTLLNSVLPEHEFVPKYEILNPSKIEELKLWFIDPDSLPKIFENDPQMVWIGATIGDVVKFTYLSEVTIEAIGYCKVIPFA